MRRPAPRPAASARAALPARALALLAPALLALAALPATGPAKAETRILADIAPVHSLVARVMQGAGEPGLLMPPGLSPHDHALRPSEARRIAGAKVIFVVGAGLAPWLDAVIRDLAPRSYLVELGELPGLPTPPPPAAQPGREPGAGAAETQLGHGLAVDPHWWLNPAVAIRWLPVIADVLAEVDPANGALYRANAEAAQAELQKLETAVAQRLRGLADRRFVVLHDAYSHFEARFQLARAGALRDSDAALPGAARVARLRRLAEAGEIACVFTEPQFPPDLAEQVAAGTGVRIGLLDPLGAALAPGPDLYPALIRNLAEAFDACLRP